MDRLEEDTPCAACVLDEEIRSVGWHISLVIQPRDLWMVFVFVGSRL